MPIIWKDIMSTGNDLIDHDHKYLICYVNTVSLALQNPKDRETINATMEQLYKYAYSHFNREEKIQSIIRYPDIENHKKEHMLLLENLVTLKNNITRVYTVEQITEKYDEISSFMKNWLLNHVLTTDKRLEPYLQRHKNKLSQQRITHFF